MKRFLLVLLAALLAGNLCACALTLMPPPTEAEDETFGTRPQEGTPQEMWQYRLAMAALRDQDYPQAYALFLELGDFKDAAEYASRFVTMADMLLSKTVEVDSEKLPDYVSTYVYDAQGRVLRENRDSSGQDIGKIQYDYEGNTVRITSNTGIRREVYNTDGRLEWLEETVFQTGDSGRLVYTWGYSYDEQGLLIQEEGTVVRKDNNRSTGLYNFTGLYFYDEAGHLTSYVRVYTWGKEGTYREDYTYDEAGNRIAMVRTEVSAIYTEQLTETCTYDPEGKLLTLDRRTVGFRSSAEELLEQSHTQYIWQDGHIIEEVLTEGVEEVITTRTRYDYGDYLNYIVPSEGGGTHG